MALTKYMLYIILMSSWNDLVKEKFRLGRMVNPKYSLMQAMKAAKKVYKKVSATQTSKKSRKAGPRKSKGRKSRGRKTRGRKSRGRK